MEFSFSKTGTIYPYTKTEEAVSLNMEIDVLRQSTYEQQQTIQDLIKRIEVLEKKSTSI